MTTEKNYTGADLDTYWDVRKKLEEWYTLFKCNIDLSKIDLIDKELNYFSKFNYSVEWNFNLSNNKLTSLDWCPKKVTGDFNCRDNKLKSLKWWPIDVWGAYNCALNYWLSFIWAPEKVDSFYWVMCLSGSLEWCPKIINKDFLITANNLWSLKWSPEVIWWNFWIAANNLTTLIWWPKLVKWNLSWVSQWNNITSLEWFPKVIWTIDCSDMEWNVSEIFKDVHNFVQPIIEETPEATEEDYKNLDIELEKETNDLKRRKVRFN